MVHNAGGERRDVCDPITQKSRRCERRRVVSCVVRNDSRDGRRSGTLNGKCSGADCRRIHRLAKGGCKRGIRTRTIGIEKGGNRKDRGSGYH